MNLISNCCLSNFLLRKWGFGNTNPFTWVDMNFGSFYNLLTSYDTIDWDNVKLTARPHPYNQGQPAFDLTIDNKATVTYIHYLFHPEAKQLVTCGQDVYYYKIWDFIIQKYYERKDLMLKSGKDPVFVLEWEHLDYDEVAFEKLLATDLKYKVVVITYNTKFKDVKKDNLLVIYDPHGRGGGYEGAGHRFPDWYADKYNEVIKEFIENDK